jgi:hypothetical protein
MTQDMSGADSAADDGMDRATGRLARALAALEAKVAARASEWEERSGDLFGQGAVQDDRARLAADLDAARARERALEEVAAEASAALGRAAAEVRAALAAGEG